MSLPTVLHHFGSRDGLIEATLVRAFDALSASIVDAIRENAAEDAGLPALIEGVHQSLAQTGQGRALGFTCA